MTRNTAKSPPKVAKATTKVSARDKYLQRTYGITEKQFNDLFKKQNNACAICKKPPAKGKNLCVDHDHRTLIIRGLLCTFCNRRVIGRHRSSELLFNASEYLRQDTGWVMPPKKKKRKKRK